jgi:hypothetical protein
MALRLGLSPDLPLSQHGFSAYVKRCQFGNVLKPESIQGGGSLTDRFGFTSGPFEPVWPSDSYQG